MRQQGDPHKSVGKANAKQAVVPPHKKGPPAAGDSTLQQRVNQMIANASSFGGRPKDPPQIPQAASDATARGGHGPKPGIGEAGWRTAKEFDDDRRALRANADSVLSGKRKYKAP